MGVIIWMFIGGRGKVAKKVSCHLQVKVDDIVGILVFRASKLCELSLGKMLMEELY